MEKRFFTMVSLIGIIITTSVLVIFVTDMRDYIPTADIDEQVEFIHDSGSLSNYSLDVYTLNNSDLLIDDETQNEIQTGVYKSDYIMNYTMLSINETISNCYSYDFEQNNSLQLYTLINVGNLSANESVYQMSFFDCEYQRTFVMYQHPSDSAVRADLTSGYIAQAFSFFDNSITIAGTPYTIPTYNEINMCELVIENATNYHFRYYNLTDIVFETPSETLTRAINNTEYVYILAKMQTSPTEDFLIGSIGFDSTYNPEFYNQSVIDFVFNESVNSDYLYQDIREYTSTTNIIGFSFEIVNNTSNEYHYYQIDIEGVSYYNVTEITDIPVRDFEITITSLSKTSNFSLFMNISVDYGFNTTFDDYVNAIIPSVMILGFAIGLIYILLSKKQ